MEAVFVDVDIYTFWTLTWDKMGLKEWRICIEGRTLTLPVPRTGSPDEHLFSVLKRGDFPRQKPPGFVKWCVAFPWKRWFGQPDSEAAQGPITV